MILVTGGSGFVGGNLIRELDRTGSEFVSLGRSGPKGLDGSRHCYGDVCSREDVRRCLGRYKVDVVVHLANVVSARRRCDFETCNVLGMENLVGACEERCVGRFVYVSSLNVTLPARNAYTISKEKCEAVLRQASIRRKVILRPSVMFGPGDRGYIGKLIARVQRNGLVLCPVGGPLLQPIYVGDVVSLFMHELNRPGGDECVEICCGGSERFTYRELIDTIASCVNRRAHVVQVPINALRAFVNIVNVLMLGRWWLYVERLKSFHVDRIVSRTNGSYIGHTSVLEYLNRLPQVEEGG